MKSIVLALLALATALVAEPAFAQTPPGTPNIILPSARVGSDGEIYIPYNGGWISVLKRSGDSILGSLSISGSTLPPFINLYSSVPANGAYFSLGPTLSIASTAGHAPGDSLRTSAYFKCTSYLSYVTQETCADIDMTNAGGGINNWVANTPYPGGSSVSYGANSYTTTSGGTSSASSPPTCTSGTCNDGSIVWKFVTQAINNGKEGLSIALTYTGNGATGDGNGWGQATAITIAPNSFPGVAGGSAIIDEKDIVDNAKDCPPATAGACQTFGLFLEGIATQYTNTIGIFGGGSGGSNYYYHWGIALLNNFAKDIAYLDATGAPIGYESRGTRGSTGIAFHDSSSGGWGGQLWGTYAHAALDTTGATIAGNDIALAIGTNQQACFSSNYNACLLYSNVVNGLVYTTPGGTSMFSVTNSGFNVLAGSMTQLLPWASELLMPPATC